MKSKTRKSSRPPELLQLMLAEPAWTLAIAESLTAGQLQTRVGAISGASAFFRGGITAYSLEQKVKLLGVERAAARRVDCVSAQVAEQTARGSCALFDADVGVATTGYAEPSPKQQVIDPFAWWAVVLRKSRSTFSVRFGRVECPGCSRQETQAIVADAAMAELIAFLRELRGG
jgi:nicotinamide-nucleotide amidase